MGKKGRVPPLRLSVRRKQARVSWSQIGRSQRKEDFQTQKTDMAIYPTVSGKFHQEPLEILGLIFIIEKWHLFTAIP